MVSVGTSIVPPGPRPPPADTPDESSAVTTSQVTPSIQDFAVSLAHDPGEEWLNRRDLARLEVTIGHANGKTLTLKVDTANIDVLDGRNPPNWQPDIPLHAILARKQ